MGTIKGRFLKKRPLKTPKSIAETHFCVSVFFMNKKPKAAAFGDAFGGLKGGAFIKKSPFIFVLNQQILENSSFSQSPSNISISPRSQAVARLGSMGSFAVAGMPKRSAVSSTLLSP